jgi:hypothetical protein
MGREKSAVTEKKQFHSSYVVKKFRKSTLTRFPHRLSAFLPKSARALVRRWVGERAPRFHLKMVPNIFALDSKIVKFDAKNFCSNKFSSNVMPFYLLFCIINSVPKVFAYSVVN